MTVTCFPPAQGLDFTLGCDSEDDETVNPRLLDEGEEGDTLRVGTEGLGLCRSSQEVGLCGSAPRGWAVSEGMCSSMQGSLDEEDDPEEDDIIVEGTVGTVGTLVAGRRGEG